METDRNAARSDAAGPELRGAADAAGTGSEDADSSTGPSLIARLFRRGASGERPEDDGAAAPMSKGEREMLLNVRRMTELRVIDVMVPRADIDGVDLEADFAELVDAFRDTRHTRLPVYRETLDDPVGFVHLKDVALRHGFAFAADETAADRTAADRTAADRTAADQTGAVEAGADETGTDATAAKGGAAAQAPPAVFDLRALLRPMLYVPPSMPVDALLQKMQGGRIHMALVIDEYGGVDGLVTIEDVLEQIVGDIEDEHDVASALTFREEGPGVYLASARLEIPEFEAVAHVDLLADDVDEDVDTLGGLVFMLADRVPERGEVIVHPDGHEFEVLDADPRRIKRLRVRLAVAHGAPPRPEAPPPEAQAPEAQAPEAQAEADVDPRPEGRAPRPNADDAPPRPETRAAE